MQVTYKPFHQANEDFIKKKHQDFPQSPIFPLFHSNPWLLRAAKVQMEPSNTVINKLLGDAHMLIDVPRLKVGQ